MRTKKLSLVVVPLLLTACSQSNVLQQDVYNNQYDCRQDWRYELCEPDSTGSSGYVSAFVGPQYYKKNRKVRYLGKVVKATGKRHNGNPLISTQLNSASKSTPIRGGFGSSSGSSGG
ncbi:MULTISPECIES: hypothetical protein [unclassified Acinetobacter]|uniref:hypothetical protein n=1 Tax=unclassified Acinetobacter TaxID=196816 RepID=UPI0015D30117|nr:MULTISPECIES: hypothetical protein [unclassified Acinetobacter]